MPVSLDCFCTNGGVPPCPPCIVATATMLRHDHPDSLSIALLKRRIRGITGHEAALLCEMSKLVLRISPAHAANREARYVERPPTDNP